MTVAPAQRVWKDFTAASMAFFWAEDPSALSVPSKQSAPDPVPEPAVALVPVAESLPQAPRASEPVSAKVSAKVSAMTGRVIFTRQFPSSVEVGHWAPGRRRPFPHKRR
ncbi:MAG: hypothetical protein V9G08_03570 [Dermatophilaceae bacterium]